ncbi:MAG: type II secretion system F family protein [Candidatus Eremiobacteraeota bacterium]|nr:type II secretion system F family protein [Candidatus Eremiobacteraeota bacterium]
MKRFHYLALNRKGDTVSGEMDAADSGEVIARLKQEKMRPLNVLAIKEYGPPPGKSLLFKVRRDLLLLIKNAYKVLAAQLERSQKIDERKVSIFTHQLSAMLGAGIPITAGIKSILSAESDRKFALVLEQLVTFMESGHSPHNAFGRFPGTFSRAYAGLVGVGQSSGRLPAVMEKQAQDLEKYYSFKRKVISSLTYPAFVMAFAIISVFVMMIYFVPGFTGIYRETRMPLPFITVMLVTTVNYLTNPLFWAALAAAAAVGIFLLKNYLATPVGRYYFETTKLSIPVLGGLIAQSELYIIFLNLATMMECGITISDSLTILVEMTPHPIFREMIIETIESLNSGETFSDAIKSHPLVPHYVTDLCGVGESTGDLPSMIRRSATMMEEHVNGRLETFLNLLEPVIISMLAFAVAFIMIAIFLPLYNIINSFS